MTEAWLCKYTVQLLLPGLKKNLSRHSFCYELDVFYVLEAKLSRTLHVGVLWRSPWTFIKETSLLFFRRTSPIQLPTEWTAFTLPASVKKLTSSRQQIISTHWSFPTPSHTSSHSECIISNIMTFSMLLFSWLWLAGVSKAGDPPKDSAPPLLFTSFSL